MTIDNAVYRLVLFSIILVLVLSTSTASSNPIPVPGLVLTNEYVEITIARINDTAIDVCVEGVYMFYNSGLSRAAIYFPIPREVDPAHVWIRVSGGEVEWSIVDRGLVDDTVFRYYSALGELPMLEILVDGIGGQRSFNILVMYRYNVTAREGVFKTIYALGVEKTIGYPVRPVVYIKMVFIGLEGYRLDLVLTGYSRGANNTTLYRVHLDDYDEEIELRRENTRLLEDLVIVLKKTHGGAGGEEWVEGSPVKALIEVSCHRTGNRLYDLNITVNMVFNHLGYRIEWTGIERAGNVFKIHAKVLEWTGSSAQAITKEARTFNVRGVDPGVYSIELYVNGRLFNKTSIEIPSQSIGEEESREDAQVVGSNTKGSMDYSTVYTALLTVLVAVFIAILVVARTGYASR